VFSPELFIVYALQQDPSRTLRKMKLSPMLRPNDVLDQNDSTGKARSVSIHQAAGNNDSGRVTELESILGFKDRANHGL